ncbi:MAG: transglutaminase family protein [Halofilum sp. (in: g-proteobacteria)]|nr:transglutaminase family protein [Halofilum sp. (in: g-proteobacteria)]
MDRFLAETPLLDWTHESIDALFMERKWDGLDAAGRARVVHEFVRDEIPFGYNRREIIPASRVLAEGMGQCNSKGTLLMACWRRGGIPCRFHAFAVSKRVQAGVMVEGLHDKLPGNIQHSWVEALIGETWLKLEGFIVDSALLAGVQSRFADWQGDFCGYALAVDDLHHPPNEWNGGDTDIQHRAIMGDLGVFASPDEFYAEYPSNLSGPKGLLWRLLYFVPTNRNVAWLRVGNFPADAERFAGHCPPGLFPRG